MATDSSTQTSTEQLGPDLAAAFASADTSSTQVLQNMRLIHEARLSQQKRTAAALKKQYGESNEEVKAAEQSVRLTTARVAAIHAVYQQASTPAPQVTSTGWALQGRVYHSTEASEPAAHYTVYFTDSNNTFQRQYGVAYTDTTGLYLINYAGDDQQKEQGTEPQLQIQIANTKGKLVYISATPFQPVIGTASYLDIYLPQGETVLGDPPPAVRKIVMPSSSKEQQTQ